MIRLFFRLIYFSLAMLGVVVIAAFFLPKHYTVETTIMIKAAPPIVYERAMDLPAWHALAQAAQLPLEKIDGDQLMQLLLQLPSGNGVVGAGVRLDTVRQYIAQGGSALVDKGVNQLKMVCRITETNPPHAFSLRVEGGPFHGLTQSVTLFPTGEGMTTLTMTEQRTVEGFWGGVKAWLSKNGAYQINDRNLSELKRLCEK
ncbi:MAG TPA: SRPBCC family protein [bacterium]|nr:SRPBCC family protein [bacterium]HMW37044.1 SRPBCC family protein [bacterium]HMY37393.1 SRPBCC family protein [bacterium]HMZ05004.1 SRPBCC family protein [bacterium]HNB56170.1 SRPBCC family protein [bacterium]